MVEVVHSGCLEICKAITTSKGWSKRLFVLKRFHSSGTSALEFYKDTKKDFRKMEAKGVLNLIDNYQVEIVNNELLGCYKKFVFDVRTVEATYRLSADSQSEMDTWIRQLQMQTKLKPAADLGIAYHVRPQSTEANKRIGATGECTMQMSKAGVKLALHPSGSLVAEWPLQCLRRYACDAGKFHFEAGRKAPLGEGLYVFQTADGDSMFEVLDYLIKAEAGQLVKPPPELQHSAPTPGYHHLNHSPHSTMVRPAGAGPGAAATMGHVAAAAAGTMPAPTRPPPALPTSTSSSRLAAATMPAHGTAGMPRFDPGAPQPHHAIGNGAPMTVRQPPPQQPQSEYSLLDRGQGSVRSQQGSVRSQQGRVEHQLPAAAAELYNTLQAATGAAPQHTGNNSNGVTVLNGALAARTTPPKRFSGETALPETREYRNLSDASSSSNEAHRLSGGSGGATTVRTGGALPAERGEWRRLSGPRPDSGGGRDYDQLAASFDDDMVPNKFYGCPVKPQ